MGATEPQRQPAERYNIVKQSKSAGGTRYGINEKTVAKWRKRGFIHDMLMEPRNGTQ